MSSNTLGSRLPWAAVVLLLVLAGCSSADQTAQPAGAPTSGAPSAVTPSAAQPSAAQPSAARPSATKPGTPNPAPSKAPARPTGAPKPTGPPPATTPVPPPTPGDVNTTVPTRPERSQKPVKLDQPSQTGTGLTAELVSIKSTQAQAQLPGEVAGPALAITVEVKNDSTKPADLNTVVVTVLDSGGAPGGEMTASPAKPLSGTLARGKTARGVYVFTMPATKRKPITVNVTISSAPVLVFTGNAG